MRTGARIAELRRIHGATQQSLALRANVSHSLLRKVERGERAATHAFVAAIARALHVNVTDITEQPYGVYNAHPSSEQAGVPALRQAFVEGDDPDLDTAPRGVDDLRQELAQLKEWDRLTNHSRIVNALPDLLRHLHASRVERPIAEQPSIDELLSAAYAFALISLYRLGHLDLAHLADERSRTCASQGNDPLRAAAAEWNHSLILLFDGSYTAGLRSSDRATQLTENSDDVPARTAVQGAIHLRAAILAARACDRENAQARLDAAQTLVTPEHEAANHYVTKFGATNLAIYRVAVPVELADGTTAVTRASTVHLPAHTAPSRAGHYWIDLSRGWLMHGDRQRALDCLQQARRIAPQLTRYHPQVRQTIQTLAAQDSRATQTLAGFAAWCGINT